MWYSITLAVGIILLIISLRTLQQSLSFLRKSNRATGTVIEMERISDSDGSTYKPIFKFKAATGQEVIFKSSSSSNPPSWKVGEEATIAYDPNDPGEARLLTYFGAFSWTIVLMALAMPMLVIGGGFYLAQQFLK